MTRLRSTNRLFCGAVFLVCGLVLGVANPASQAGNRQMVEERTEELIDLNQEAIGQIPEELPENGQVDVKAEVVEEAGEPKVKVQEYSITRGKILRNNQDPGGGSRGAAKSSRPRTDPAKK